MAKEKAKTGSLIFIFITLLVDVIGIGIIIPVIPDLIENLTGITDEGVQAWYGGWLIFAFAITQFLFSPLLGELSDKFGRRPILLMSLFGLGVDYIFHAFAPTITWLFVGRILAGITGASHTVATAYIADISTPENKARNFGMVGAAFGLGFIIGPAIGALFSEWGVQLPFLIAAGLTLLNFLFGYFFVPESLPKEKRRELHPVRMLPGVSAWKLRDYHLGGLVIAYFLATLAGQVLPSVWSFFTKKVYHYDPTEIGISLVVVGVMVTIVQAGLVGWSVKKFGNRKVILYGFILLTIGMCLFAFATIHWYLYIFLVPYVLGGVATPTLQSIMSNGVPENEQGNLQGSLTSLISITQFIAPIFFASFLFAKFAEDDAVFYFPGMPYIVAGGILVIATVIAMVSLRKLKDIQEGGSGNIHQDDEITDG